MRSDLQLLKQLKFDAVRKHVKYEPALWYRACDELGLIVWQDMPSMSPGVRFDLPPPTGAQYDEWQRQLLALVDGHRSFPSIMAWVLNK